MPSVPSLWFEDTVIFDRAIEYRRYQQRVNTLLQREQMFSILYDIDGSCHEYSNVLKSPCAPSPVHRLLPLWFQQYRWIFISRRGSIKGSRPQ